MLCIYTCTITYVYSSTSSNCIYFINIPYSAERWWGKTLANQSFQSFGEENIGEFKLLIFIGSGVWLGKILANNIRFTKLANVFPHHCFALYGMCTYIHTHNDMKLMTYYLITILQY